MSEESADIPGARRESTWKRIKERKEWRETQIKKTSVAGGPETGAHHLFTHFI
jgi:hypothetical protein